MINHFSQLCFKLTSLAGTLAIAAELGINIDDLEQDTEETL